MPALTLLLLLLVFGGVFPAVAGEPAREPLTLVTESGRHAFAVELADTPARRELGLMHRRELDPGHGMLFDFGRPRPGVAMWMKNTYVSLDMFFLGPQGEVLKIATSTTPGSLTPIAAPRPVRAVLELLAGTAKRTGARVGDRVEHGIFEREE